MLVPVGGGSKTFEDWGGLQKFSTGGGVTDLGGVTFAGGIRTPLHAMIDNFSETSKPLY